MQTDKPTLTHVRDGNPAMVDVADKPITRRRAVAEAVVDLGAQVMERLSNNDIHGPKGPVFQTAMIAGTMAAKLYGGANMIRERHRHRYEFNADYRELVEEAGMVISSHSAKEGLVEIVELPEHPFFIGVQFHPEFLSKPNHPHPIFAGFIQAALAVP